jgi:hypothetical protein
MNLVENTYFYIDSPNFLGVTTINARLTADNSAANNVFLKLFEGVFQVFF